jgi:hypothetical protein
MDRSCLHLVPRQIRDDEPITRGRSLYFSGIRRSLASARSLPMAGLILSASRGVRWETDANPEQIKDEMPRPAISDWCRLVGRYASTARFLLRIERENNHISLVLE